MTDDEYWAELEREEDARQQALREQLDRRIVDLNEVERRKREILAEQEG
jgi:hypothetical protein